jgi:hypothetical protein
MKCEAVARIQLVGDNAIRRANEVTTLTENVKQEIANGRGIANLLLKDSSLSLNSIIAHYHRTGDSSR